MRKFEIKATELSDTDVNFVSLVKRGANRIPFRITKGDNDMIDLHKIGRTMFAKAEKPAAVIGVVTRSGADLKAVRNVLKAAGINHSAFVKKNDEETTVYKAEGDYDGVMLLKMNDDFALAVSGLKKAFAHYDFDSKDFKSVHATNAFAASVTSALDSLRNTLANIMDGSKSPKEAAEAIDSAVDEFKSHVTTLVANLPEKAMKADAELLKGAKAAGGCDDDQETGDGIGDKANGGNKAARKADSAVGENEDEALNKKGPCDAKKAHAGKNGTGAGAEQGKGTETKPRATSDDEENTEVNAKPGEKTSGSDSGMPEKAKAKAKKEEWRGKGGDDVDSAPKGSTTRNSFVADADGDGDDDTVMTGESAAGEGAAEAPADSEEAQRRATEDDKRGSKNMGRPGAPTLDMDGAPEKAKAPTQKNDGEVDAGKKRKGRNLPEEQSGAGARETDVQTYKSDDPIMQALSALARSVQEGLVAVTQKVDAIDRRVNGVAALAKKTDAALNGTVFGEAESERVVSTRKSGAGAPPLLDTAYSRRESAA
jgi:hypothetical protein